MKPTREEIDTLWSQCIRRSTDKRRRDAFYDAAYSAGRKAGMEEAQWACKRLAVRHAGTQRGQGAQDCIDEIDAAMEADT